MGKHRDGANKKVKEEEIRRIEQFGMVAALFVIALSVLFVSGFLQSIWLLRVVLIIGILMNLSVAIAALVRRQTLLWIFCLLVVAAQIAVYFYLL